jgi:hypothetical protein
MRDRKIQENFVGVVLMRLNEQISDNLLESLDKLEAQVKMMLSGESGCGNQERPPKETYATALRFGLRTPDLLPDEIHLGVKLTDREGMFYPQGVSTEVDLVKRNHYWTVFKIKANAEPDDIVALAFKLELLRAQNPDEEIRAVLFSLNEEPELKQCCQLYQIELVEPFSTLSEPWAQEWIAREDEEILRAEHPELFDTDLPDSDQ